MNISPAKSLLVATGNAGKLRELKTLLEPLGFTLRAQNEFDFQPAEETGSTFVENALLKARKASQCTGLPALADDSGLCVTALDGAPGVHSARYAGEDASDKENNDHLLANLTGISLRRAWFHCALVLMRHGEDPAPLIAQASWWGEILAAPQGEGGFGYDPLFYDADLEKTSAQLPPELKNRVSHRGMALQKLAEQLRQETP